MCSCQYAAVLTVCCRCTDPQCLKIANRPVYIRNNITTAPVMASNTSLNKSGSINSLGLISSLRMRNTPAQYESNRVMPSVSVVLALQMLETSRNARSLMRSGPPKAEHDSVRGILKDDVH